MSPCHHHQVLNNLWVKWYCNLASLHHHHLQIPNLLPSCCRSHHVGINPLTGLTNMPYRISLHCLFWVMQISAIPERDCSHPSTQSSLHCWSSVSRWDIQTLSVWGLMSTRCHSTVCSVLRNSNTCGESHTAWVSSSKRPKAKMGWWTTFESSFT